MPSTLWMLTEQIDEYEIIHLLQLQTQSWKNIEYNAYLNISK